jgi:hypothetical protein
MVVAWEGDRRTKAGKAAYAQMLEDHPGATIISIKESRQIQKMVKALQDHPIAGPLLFDLPGRNEEPIEWVHPRTGHRCRTKLDRLVELDGKRILIDLKGMSGIAPGVFSGSMARYRYDVQMSFAADGCSCANLHVDEVKIVAIDKGLPHEIAVYNLTEDRVLQHGRDKYESALDLLETCATRNEWPGAFEDKEIDINLPTWAESQSDKDLFEELGL